MEFEELLEKLPKNKENGKYILNDEYVEQIFKKFFSKNSEERTYAQCFVLEGICGEDVSNIDMSELSPEYFKMMTFDSETKFSQEQINKFQPNKIIEQGKNFLNVKDNDGLHNKGINGEGTTIALIDTCFDSSIEEYEGRVIQHLVIENVEGKINFREYSKEDGDGPHGETTASLAVGKECGVAPKAKMYLFGIDAYSWPEGPEQTKTAWTEAKAAMLKYLEKEKIIPDAISMSADYETLPEAQNALQWLKENGCNLLDSREFWSHLTLGRTNEKGEIVLDKWVKTIYENEIQYDKNSEMGKRIEAQKEKGKNAIIMPFAGRTSIHTGKSGKPTEKYNGSFCGASYAIPQIEGLFLLERQINKDISFDEFIGKLRNPEKSTQMLGSETLKEQEDTASKKFVEQEMEQQLKELENEQEIAEKGR